MKHISSIAGVTYKEDRPMVQEALNKLVASGAYPEKLF